MISVHKHEGGSTKCVDSVDPAWLKPDSGVWVWVDLDQATADEARVLSTVFHFHELAIEDALSEVHQPKIESYGTYLYLILHGIDFSAAKHRFQTRDIDFFLGQQFLVTVHKGASRSIDRVSQACGRDTRVLGEDRKSVV